MTGYSNNPQTFSYGRRIGGPSLTLSYSGIKPTRLPSQTLKMYYRFLIFFGF